MLAQAEISGSWDTCYYGGTYDPDCPEVIKCEDCSYQHTRLPYYVTTGTCS